MRTLLVIQTGSTVPDLKARRGDFDAWFAEHLSRPGLDLQVVRPDLGEPLPLAMGLAGVLVTGSPASVTGEEPWMAETAGFLLGAAYGGAPVLGVCFGHQLVADAFGGKIMENPRGRELGTTCVNLTPKGRRDPLFEGLPEVLVVQQSHQDVVALLPEGGEILAANELSEVQALRVGDKVRGVQFHPEFDADIVRGYVDAREPALRAEAEARGEDPDQALADLRASLRDSDHGRRVLQNWLTHFVGA